MSARYLAADEVAALLDRSPARVYVIAHRHGWRRIRHHGQTYYHPHDVRHSLDRLTTSGGVKDP